LAALMPRIHDLRMCDWSPFAELTLGGLEAPR